MPIKPDNRHHYRTPEWKAARLAVLKRAGEVRSGNRIKREARCEFCWAHNHGYLARYKVGGETWQRHVTERVWTNCEKPEVTRTFDSIGDCADALVVKIVLTVAHLDHDPTNNDLGNLRALCQRCHNRHDVEHRKANRARTHAKKKAAGRLLDGKEHNEMPRVEGQDK